MKEYAEHFNKGDRRKVSSEYRRLNNKKTRLAKKLQAVTGEVQRDKMVTEIRQIMAQTYITTFCEPMDANYRRIQYTRYADDFLICNSQDLF